MTNDPYSRRAYIIAASVVFVVMIFIVRLFWLQIIDQSQKQKADSNALLRQIIYPSRGLIYDRNGELLVFDLDADGAYRSIYLVHRKDLVFSKGERDFMNFAINHIRHLRTV